MKVKSKRSQKKYDISEWSFPIPDFMSDKEISEMYTLLKGHMYMKYGVYDEETIHRTIIRGLHKADMYDSTKASKLVWFQSILYFYWIQEKSSKYNGFVDDLSLSSSLSKENPDFLLIDTIDSGDDSWMEWGEKKIDIKESVSNDIYDVIINGNYPYLQMRCMGMNYRDITASQPDRPASPTISIRLHNERKRLKEDLKRWHDPQIQIVLDDRVPVWKWTFDKYKKRDRDGSTYECFYCKKSFVRASKSQSKIFCGEPICSFEGSKIRSKISKEKFDASGAAKKEIHTELQCEFCDKKFLNSTGKGRKKKFCSVKCRTDKHNLK